MGESFVCYQMALRFIIEPFASDEMTLSVTDTKFRLSTSRSRIWTLNSCDSPPLASWMVFILGFDFGFDSTFDSIHCLFLQAVARMPL